MLNKTVTIVETTDSKFIGYGRFFSDENLKKPYKRSEEGSIHSDRQALFGREFKVVSVDSFLNWKKVYEHKFKLQDNAGETIYYNYDKENAFAWNFPFEVKGGLDLPEGFYCDFIEKGGLGLIAKVPEIIVGKDKYTATKKDGYTATFTFFDKFKVYDIKSVTLILENSKTIEAKTNLTYGSPQGSEFKYNFTIILQDNDVELLKATKLIGIKLKDQVHTFHPGTGVRLQGILKCLQTMPLPED